MTQTAPSGAGVPALLDIYNQAVDALSIVSADAAALQRFLSGPQWGIFSASTPQSSSATGIGGLANVVSSGISSAASAISSARMAVGLSGFTLPTLNPNTPLLVGNYMGSAVSDVAFAAESQVSTYPLEQGAFASYDKVQLPYSAKVTICVGGSFQFRQQSLVVLDVLKNTTTLVNVVTPEQTYYNATIVHYDYDRSAREGAGMLKISIWLEEIRITATATAGNASQPNGANNVSGGSVQPYTPSTSTTATVTATALN